MPCRSDYMEPTSYECESRRAARCLRYLLTATGQRVPLEIARAANDPYGNTGLLEQFVVELCMRLSHMDEATRNRIVYDGRNKDARQLADWWDEHKTADEKRQAEEREAARVQQLREVALAKLTPAEREALGVPNG